VLLLLALSARPAGAQGAPHIADRAFTDSHSIAEIARAARGLRLGARLQLEGVTLEPGGTPEGLDLERFEVFAPDARVVFHGEDGDDERPAPASVFFRGRVIGEPDSVALLSVHEDGQVRGIVQRPGGIWELAPEAPLPGGGPRRLVARQVEAPKDAEGFACAAEELPPVPGGPAAFDPMSSSDGVESSPAEAEVEAAAATSTTYTARVAVETDYELFLRFGTQAATAEYVGDLFAYASTIYDREIVEA
jgi:hypothetical protein